MEHMEERLRSWIEPHREEIVERVKELIRIPSIGIFDPAEAYPYGKGCAQALDYVLQLAQDFGLETRNYDYYAGAAVLPGMSKRTIGIFVHLDTAPCSDVWTFAPFDPVVREGHLVGIGAQDNKGAAITMLFLLRCLREMGIKLSHSVMLVFGCGKKEQMEDIDRFLLYEDAPALSLIADADFPVCKGEKGSFDFELRCPLEDSRLIDFRAGRAANMVPDQAFALLRGVDPAALAEKLRGDDRCSVVPAGEYAKLAAGGLGGHAAFPEDTQSPVPILASILLENELVDEDTAEILRFLRDTYSTVFGAPLGIDVRDEAFGYTTHICGLVRLRGGRLTQTVNVRYVPQLTGAEIVHRVNEVVRPAGMTLHALSNTPPSMLDPEMQAIAATMTSIANRALGTRLSQYTMGGVTYAKKLPRAFAFGINRADLPLPFGVGRGSGHLADEVMRVDNLTEGLLVYALSILRVDPLV